MNVFGTDSTGFQEAQSTSFPVLLLSDNNDAPGSKDCAGNFIPACENLTPCFMTLYCLLPFVFCVYSFNFLCQKGGDDWSRFYYGDPSHDFSKHLSANV
jgi:hypothetical protein